MIHKNIEVFIDLIKNKQFIQAHEALEEDWKILKQDDKKQEAKYIQALINGATALALYTIKKRKEPAEKVWSTYLRNKHLYDIIDLRDKKKYEYTMKLLEELYERKDMI